MLLGVAMFPFLNASAKYLSADYATPMIVWIRYLGHLLFMILWFMPTHGISLFVSHHPGIQLARSVLLFGSTAFNFVALSFIPLTMANAISFAAPFIVTALAVLVLGEKVGWRRWSAVAIGFIGVLVIIRPGLGEVHWAVLLALGSTLCYSVYQILTRGLGAGDNAATTIVYTALVGTFMASMVVPFYWSPPVDHWHWLLFAVMGLCGGFGHYFVVKAFQYGEAAVVAPFGYAQLIGTTILGYYIFGDIPDFWTWVGTAIIVGSSAFIAYRESLNRR